MFNYKKYKQYKKITTKITINHTFKIKYYIKNIIDINKVI